MKFFLLLLAVTCTVYGRTLQRAEKTQVFKYTTVVETSVPDKNVKQEKSELQLKCDVLVKLNSNEKALLQIRHPEFSRIVWTENDGKYSKPSMEPFNEDSEFMEKLELPFELYWNRWDKTSLKVNSEDSVRSVNIKRGVLQLLTQNWARKNLEPLEGLEQKTISIENKMDSVEGRCTSFTTIVDIPEDHKTRDIAREVTRAIDLDQCASRPLVAYNMRTQNCPSCQRGGPKEVNFLRSSTVTNFDVTKDDSGMYFAAIKSESRYNVEIMGPRDNFVQTLVRQKLVHEQFSEAPVEELSDPVETSMSFDIEPEITHEIWITEGEEQFLDKHLKESSFKIAKDLLEKLKDGKIHFDEKAATFSHMVTLVQNLKIGKLTKLFDIAKSNKNAREILIKSCAFAGSNHNIKFLKQLMENDKLTTFEMITIFNALGSVPVLSHTTVEAVKSLCPMEKSEKNQQVFQACWLAHGSMVNKLCNHLVDERHESYHSTRRLTFASLLKAPERISKQERPFVEKFICTKQQRKEYYEKVIEMVYEATDDFTKVVLLKTIGNMGVPEMIRKTESNSSELDEEETPFTRLTQLIRKQSVKPHIRREALRAISRISNKRSMRNSPICKVAMPIFLNKYEPSVLRMEAAAVCIESEPRKMILDDIARQIQIESNPEVASFVYTYMSSLVKSSQPCFKNMTENMRDSLRLVRKVPTELFRSSFNEKSLHSIAHRFGIDASFIKMFDVGSMIPKTLSAQLRSNFFGFLQDPLFKLTVDGYNLPQLIQFVLEEMEENRGDSQVETMKKMLNDILAKHYNEKEDHTSLSELTVTWFNRDMIYVPMNVQKIVKHFTSNAGYLHKYLEYAYNKMHNQLLSYATMLSYSKLMVPTTMGLPLVVTTRLPVFANVHTQMKPESSWNHLQMMPQIVGQYMVNVYVKTPTTSAGFRLNSIARVTLPINLLVEEMPDNKYKIGLKIDESDKKQQIVRVATRPEVFFYQWHKDQTSWKSPIVKRLDVSRDLSQNIYTRKMKLSKTLFGTKFTLKTDLRYGPWMTIDNKATCPLTTPNEIELDIDRSEKRQYAVAFNPWKLIRPKYDMTEHKYKGKASIMFIDNDENTYEQICFYDHPSSAQHERSSVKCEFNGRQKKYCMNFDVKSTKQHYHVADEYKMSKPEVVARWVYGWDSHNCDFESAPLENSIRLLAKAKRSPLQRQAEKSYSEKAYRRCLNNENSPIACEELVRKTNDLHRLVVTVDYMENDKCYGKYGNLMRRAFEYAKNYYFMQTTENTNNPKECKAEQRQITAQFDLCPYTRRYANVTVETPRSTFAARSVLLPMKFTPVNAKLNNVARRFGLYGPKAQGECKYMGGNQIIETFNLQTKKAELKSCWTLLAADIPKKPAAPTFQVYARKSEENTEQIETRVLLRDYEIVMKKIEDGKFVVTVNGDEVLTDSKKIYTIKGQFRLKLFADKLVTLRKLSGLSNPSVEFDGISVAVKKPFLLDTRYVTGICGTTILNIESQKRSRFSELISKFSPECEEKPTCEYDCEHISTDPIKTRIVMKDGDKMCITQKPIPKCNADFGYYASEEEVKTVNAICVSKSENLATYEEMRELMYSYVTRHHYNHWKSQGTLVDVEVVQDLRCEAI